jgi:hypothetical protein
MAGHAVYVRFDPWSPHVYECDIDGTDDRIVICDVVGERRSQPLQDRLAQMPRVDSSLILLRGLSDELRDDIHDGLYDDELDELQARNATICDIVSTPGPHLELLRAPADLLRDSGRLMRLVRDVEVRALLDWAGAVWTGHGFHFVLPSGEHSDRFVRVADLFSDPISLERLADWCSHFLSANNYVVADSVTMLPLVQALEIRAVRRNPNATVLKRFMPLYDLPPERVRARFAELDRWNRELGQGDRTILSLVGVSASGGYLDRFDAALAACESQPVVRHVVVCETGQARGWDALTTMNVGRHPALECRSETIAIEVDQQRFTTRVAVGVTVAQLPTFARVAEMRPLMNDLDAAGSFRVHVARAGHRDHLSVYVDTGQMLKSPVFEARATYELRQFLVGRTPDLVLIPHHRDFETLARWVHSRGAEAVQPLPVAGDIGADLVSRIRLAREILLVDDCVITSHTVRAMLEVIQRIKATPGALDYAIRALVLVARTANQKTWDGLRRRFFIKGTHNLHAVWDLPLPDFGFGAVAPCPWCSERAFLTDRLSATAGPVREYFEERLRRLSSPDGLQDSIFLLSDVPGIPDSAVAARTSPHSYMGSISDVGAFAFAAALVQQVRREPAKKPEQYYTRRIISFDEPLRQYTDPVIAGALLRAVYPGEAWSNETASEIRNALFEVQHMRQHPVLAAEIMLAGSRGKLPSSFPFREYLTPFAADSPAGLNNILSALLPSD